MKKKQLKIIMSIIVLLFLIIACGTPAEEWQLRGWTVTPNALVQPTQTPIVIEITSTPENTPSPAVTVIVQTSTPNVVRLCVTADQSVHVREQPNAVNGNIITTLLKGDEVLVSGLPNGNWIYARHNDHEGWINSTYLGECS